MKSRPLLWDGPVRRRGPRRRASQVTSPSICCFDSMMPPRPVRTLRIRRVQSSRSHSRYSASGIFSPFGDQLTPNEVKACRRRAYWDCGVRARSRPPRFTTGLATQCGRGIQSGSLSTRGSASPDDLALPLTAWPNARHSSQSRLKTRTRRYRTRSLTVAHPAV
jgi:hypothetical protein